MKIFLEADLAKGSGAIRWEGVTSRRLRRFVKPLFAVITVIALFALPRL